MNFREIRLKLQLTRKEMAHLLSLPVRTYEDWEKEKTVPHMLTLEGCAARIAKFLKRKETA